MTRVEDAVVDEERAGLVLTEVVEMIRSFRLAGQRWRARSISGTRIGVLQHLEHGEARLTELAHRLYVSAPVASRAVDALEAEGLVRRRTDHEDARVCLISITERGREELAARQQYVTGLFADAMSDWSPDEVDEAVAVLHRLNTHVAALAASLAPDTSQHDSPPHASTEHPVDHRRTTSA